MKKFLTIALFLLILFIFIQDSTASTLPDEERLSNQYGLKAVRAPQAWNFSIGNPNVYVAVLDSGIDFSHPDLINNFAPNYSKNIIDESESCKDDDGHGTNVAGIVGAFNQNGSGVFGVSLKSKIIAFKVLKSNGQGKEDYAIKALKEVLKMVTDENNPVKIAAVNLSLGGNFDDKTPSECSNDNNEYWKILHELDATNKVVIVVAAGNEGIEVGSATKSDDPDKKLNEVHEEKSENDPGGNNIGYYPFSIFDSDGKNYVPGQANGSLYTAYVSSRHDTSVRTSEELPDELISSITVKFNDSENLETLQDYLDNASEDKGPYTPVPVTCEIKCEGDYTLPYVEICGINLMPGVFDKKAANNFDDLVSGDIDSYFMYHSTSIFPGEPYKFTFMVAPADVHLDDGIIFSVEIPYEEVVEEADTDGETPFEYSEDFEEDSGDVTSGDDYILPGDSGGGCKAQNSLPACLLILLMPVLIFSKSIKSR